jgi:hypothetical protein
MAATLFAGTADDLLGQYAMVKTMRGMGFSRGEIAKRMRLGVPVFAAATWAAAQVQTLLGSGRELEAGALFGASAVALSLTSALQTMALYKLAYDTLLAEGKIADKVGPLAGSPEFQAALKTFERAGRLLSPAHKPELLSLVRSHLEPLAATLGRAEVDAILTSLEHLDLAQIEHQIKAPSQLARWKVAIRQNFANPTSLGVVLGSALAPAIGAGAAEVGAMHNGFAMAAIGSVESLVGGLTVHAAALLDDWKYRRSLERKIAAIPTPR